MTMFETEILALRDKLPRGRPSDVKPPVYDLMSDAFVWSDEIVDFKSLTIGEAGALRALWRFRTSLITGVADTRFQTVWESFRAIAPDWIGFAADRMKYSDELASEYKDRKNKKRKGGSSS